MMKLFQLCGIVKNMVFDPVTDLSENTMENIVGTLVKQQVESILDSWRKFEAKLDSLKQPRSSDDAFC